MYIGNTFTILKSKVIIILGTSLRTSKREAIKVYFPVRENILIGMSSMEMILGSQHHAFPPKKSNIGQYCKKSVIFGILLFDFCFNMK